MAELKFIITADNKGMMEALQETQQAMRTTARNVEQIGQLLDLQEFRDASASVTDFANKLYDASRESVNNLSNMSQEFTAQANTIRSEMESMLGGGSMDGMADKLDDYKQAVMDASAAAETAYNVQGVAVSTLAEELDSLKQAQEAALSAGDSGTAQALQGDIDALSGTLQQAQEQLSQLGAQADTANQQLNNLDATFAQFGGNAQNVGSAFDGIKGKISEATEATKNWLTGNGKFTEGINSMKDALGGMGGAFTPAIAGAKKMLVALRAMIATPIGAVLTAVVVALQAMHKWFTKSAEGQRAFAKVSGYITSVLGTLTDIAVAVGKYLFRAFSDPNKPLGAFARNLVGTFSNALKSVYHLVKGLGSSLASLGTIIKGIGTMSLDTISAGWERLKNAGTLMGQAFKEAGSAAANAFGTIINLGKSAAGVVSDVWDAASFSGFEKYVNDQIKKAQTAGQLKQDEVDATIKLQEAQAKQAEYDKQIGEQYEKLYKLKGKERQDAIEELKRLQKTKFEDAIKAQTQLYEITKKNNSLHSSTLEDLQKERDLRVQVLQTQAQQANSTRMLARMEASNANQMAKAAKGGGKNVTIDLKAVREAEAALEELERKQDSERISQTIALEERINDARIAAMKDGAEKVAAQREAENKQELLQLAEQLKAAKEAEYQRQKARYEAEQKLLPASERKPWDAAMLDQNEIDKIVAQYDKLANLIKEKQQQIIEEESQSAMREYLKAYGTYQEQILAITQEYAEKIAEAQAKGNKGEEKRLARERDNRLSELNARNIAMSIDWGAAFRGVGNVLGDIARETLQKVEEYMRTSEFRNLDATNKKSYIDLRNRLREETGAGSSSPFNFKQWKQIEEQVNEYKDNVRRLNIAQRAHTEAVNDLEEAQERLKRAVDEREKQEAKVAVAAAQTAVDITAANQNSAQGAVEESQANLTSSTNAAAQGIDNFASYLNEMKNGSLYGFANGITKLITSLKGGSDGVGKALGELGGKIGGLIGAILQIIDALGDDPAGFIGGLLDNVGDAVEKILADLPKLIGNIVEGVVGIVKGIFAGIGAWFAHGTENQAARTTERLTESNNALRNSIDKLTDEFEKQAGGEAIKQYQKALANQEAYNKNQQDILMAQMGKYGKHRSNAYYLSGELSSADYRAISGAIKKNISNLQGLFSLSPEDIDKIRTELPALWTRIISAGKYDDVKDYWEAYADEAGKTKELTDLINENLTQVSFDSMFSSFEDTLMDMGASAAEWGNKFSEMLQKSLLHFALGDEFQEKMNKWYQGWADTMKKQNGELTESQIDLYRQEWDAFLQEGLEKRNAIAKLTGYTGSDSEGSGAYKAASSFSQEQGDELNGRLTAIQIGQVYQNEQLTMAVATLQSMSVVGQEQGNTLAEMRNLMLIGNGHLEDIARYTRIASQYGTAIEQIADKIKTL